MFDYRIVADTRVLNFITQLDCVVDISLVFGPLHAEGHQAVGWEGREREDSFRKIFGSNKEILEAKRM